MRKYNKFLTEDSQAIDCDILDVVPRVEALTRQVQQVRREPWLQLARSRERSLCQLWSLQGRLEPLAQAGEWMAAVRSLVAAERQAIVAVHMRIERLGGWPHEPGSQMGSPVVATWSPHEALVRLVLRHFALEKSFSVGLLQASASRSADREEQTLLQSVCRHDLRTAALGWELCAHLLTETSPLLRAQLAQQVHGDIEILGRMLRPSAMVLQRQRQQVDQASLGLTPEEREEIFHSVREEIVMPGLQELRLWDATRSAPLRERD